MAIGFDDEFDYLDDEGDDGSDHSFAPQIKGSKKQVLTPSDDVSSVPEPVEEVSSDPVVEEVKEPERPAREFNSVIYIVKVTTNKEDRALEMVADKVKKRGVDIYALARPHGLRGYILLEAPDKDNAEEAVFNLPYVKGIIPKVVSYDEVKPMLEPVASDMKIEKSDIVEIISEPFKNEKAKVVRVDKVKGECVVSLLGAAVPIPVTVKLDNVRVIRREDEEE
jgi:transcriptional antiterminator NusG